MQFSEPFPIVCLSCSDQYREPSRGGEAKVPMTKIETWARELRRLTPQVENWFALATYRTRSTVPPLIGCELVAAVLILIKDHQTGEPSQQSQKASRRWRSLRRSLAPFENLPRCRLFIGRIERDMQFLLLFAGAHPPIREPIRTMASAAHYAWALTERPPKSLAPNGPICKFVGSALEHLGIDYSAEMISAVLRNRRH